MPKPKKTKLFYSGSSTGRSLPEQALMNENPPPDLMLTYYEIREKKGNTITRFNRHIHGRLKNETEV